MAANKDATLRKRQQIDSSKKSMFIAVALAAFVAGVALVVSFFLAQQMIYHGKIYNEKGKTLRTIKQNIIAADELKDNVRALEANQALNSVKKNPESSALRSILDALPADPNADALGASLQIIFAGEIGGLTVESLIVNSADGQDEDWSSEEDSSSTTDSTSTEDSDAEEDVEEDAAAKSIGFSMTVTGSPEAMKELLSRFEKSIRVIELTSIEVAALDNGLEMKLMGRAFYEPGRVIELGNKVVMP